MAQINVNRHKNNKVIPIASTNDKMASTNHSPYRSNMDSDWKDRLQQHGDLASVSSTVKISNIGTSATSSSTKIVDDNRFILNR
jgi:hypothetical protein